ncbi:MAG: amino terminal protease self-immunity, partial [Acidobacteria bacterium]|nr:amino terminal protease self-immunity [Acidobacteriota bacterium]
MGVMIRKPLFWAAFVVVSLGCVFVAARYFRSAYPIMTLDLRMDRDAALERARGIAGRLKLPPEAAREAASFAGDSMAQNFIELEGGGAGVLRSVIAGGLYHPYTWTVRRFKPGETRESRIRFTPQGTPYGFHVKLPEDEPGAALDAEPARAIAERAALADWQVPLTG